MSGAIRNRIETAVVDDADTGQFRCRRDIFTDPDLFELEMKHIFEGNWVYLAHESQIPAANDWFAVTVGRTPVVITRTKDGSFNAFINACSHRGAMLAVASGATVGSWSARSTAGASPTTASC